MEKKKIEEEGKHRIAAGQYANTAGLANLFKSQARPSLVPRCGLEPSRSPGDGW